LGAFTGYSGVRFRYRTDYADSSTAHHSQHCFPTDVLIAQRLISSQRVASLLSRAQDFNFNNSTPNPSRGTIYQSTIFKSTIHADKFTSSVTTTQRATS